MGSFFFQVKFPHYTEHRGGNHPFLAMANGLTTKYSLTEVHPEG
jgi:hypothetical protein